MPSHPTAEGRRDWWSMTVDLAQIFTVVIAMAALLVSGFLSARANQTAAEALALARESTDRELARNFYLGEAPRDFTSQPGSTVNAVINSNVVAIYDVWVDGIADGQPANVSMWTVQSCTGYTLPDGFEVKQVHFFDGTMSWTRDENGALSKAEDSEPPNPSTHESPGTFDAVGCG